MVADALIIMNPAFPRGRSQGFLRGTSSKKACPSRASKEALIRVTLVIFYFEVEEKIRPVYATFMLRIGFFPFFKKRGCRPVYRETTDRISAITPAFFGFRGDGSPNPPIPGAGSSNISILSRSFSSSKIRL